ncbi:ral guanine nucleotide dissociation stimulator-like 1 isoform X2 [Liolophura sinensis]|uniref:ral guanine nucleotide dissociation stimulator-like 1 isoform X2 n=1 Tax=Liolophura sinensis TaxID=3198878 RepID=UPI003158280E
MDAVRQNSTEDVKDANRFWREEREEGAIYDTYLKKVTYRTISEHDEESKTFSHLMWETQKVRTIRAGTLEKLVESFSTASGEMDSAYVNVFLATYRTFASANQVLAHLIDRYNIVKTQFEQDDKNEVLESQVKTIKSVLSVWLDTYPEDFRTPPNYECLETLLRFAEESVPDNDLAIKAQHKLDRFLKETDETGDFISTIIPVPTIESLVINTKHDKPLTFLKIKNQTFAEQLTLRDAELFMRVVPHHCLGAIWSRRNKKGRSEVNSVSATIDQFNGVSLRVISTVLQSHDLKPAQRAKIIQKWIDIAQDLREIKNFSSLKAIISGLQAHPVYRLHRVWMVVSKETKAIFDELSDIFSDENNQITSRELLMKEATAKFPDLNTGSNTLRKKKSLQKRQSWIENGIVHGTIPYLGTFLTDLTMVDTAIPDYTDEGLINFDKHRKEFEVLAQIKLLQSAAQVYNLTVDTAFWLWFDSVQVFSDHECWELSHGIEAPSELSAKIRKKSASLGHKPRGDVNFHTGMLCTFSSQEEKISVNSMSDSALSTSTGQQLSPSSSVSSLLSSDSDIPSSPFRMADMCVIKATLELDNKPTAHIYKSIMLHNTDHTNSVVQKVLEKYDIQCREGEYYLSQVMPDGEWLLPQSANVFYAMNSLADLKFVLRNKEQQDEYEKRKKKGRKNLKLSL